MKVDVSPNEQSQTCLKKELNTSNIDTKKVKHEKSEESIGEAFLQSSTLHGINRLHKDFNIIQRIVWMVLLLGCSVTFVYILTTEIENFYSYPTTTSIHINSFTEMVFPAITICNLSPYNKTKIVSLGEKYTNYFMKYTSVWGPIADPVNLNDREYQKPLYTDPVSPDSITQNSMDLKTMIQVCKFDKLPCPIPDVYTPTDVGPCFTFNADGKRTTQSKGALSNLELQVFIDQDNYIFSHYLGSGIKVLVHEPGKTPDILNEGFIVPPGSMAQAAIQTSMYKNLPAPYKSTVTGFCLDTSTGINLLKYNNYTDYACIRECQNEYLQSKIGCVLPYFPFAPPYCSLLQYPVYINAQLEDDSKNKMICSGRCPKPCEDTRYDIKVSYGQFPANFVGDILRKYQILNRTTDYMRDNIVYLNLFYEDLTITVYEQIPVYFSLGDVLANIGGQMGLFLGASILTLVEVIELICAAFLFVFRKIKQKKSP